VQTPEYTNMDQVWPVTMSQTGGNERRKVCSRFDQKNSPPAFHNQQKNPNPFFHTQLLFSCGQSSSHCHVPNIQNGSNNTFILFLSNGSALQQCLSLVRSILISLPRKFPPFLPWKRSYSVVSLLTLCS
jgi:hypothetical protein